MFYTSILKLAARQRIKIHLHRHANLAFVNAVAVKEKEPQMIVRKNAPRVDKTTSDTHGTVETARYSDAGGISQYGSYVQTLLPGAMSSDRHWHEEEDEFLYVLAGEVTVTENDGEHQLGPGDAACWPAGVANAHHVTNNSDAPCSYLIVGTRVTNDICHYPDTGRTLHTEGQNWRIVDADGATLKSGHILGVPD
jgi:uncharacterized cupin superfamily protein